MSGYVTRSQRFFNPSPLLPVAMFPNKGFHTQSDYSINTILRMVFTKQKKKGKTNYTCTALLKL